MNYLGFIWVRSLFELRAEAKRGYMGFIWWFVEPLIYMTVFYFLFGVILQLRGGIDNIPFLLCGLIAWKWFASGILSSAVSLQTNMGLSAQVYLPKYVFPTIASMTAMARFLMVFGLFILFLLIGGYSVTETWLALPLLIALQFFLIMSIGFFIASFLPFFPDFKFLLDNILLLMFFLSGIFFKVSALPVLFQEYLKYNPVTVLIESLRQILLDGIWPDWTALAKVALFSLIVFCCGLYLLVRYDRSYVKRVVV